MVHQSYFFLSNHQTLLPLHFAAEYLETSSKDIQIETTKNWRSQQAVVINFPEILSFLFCVVQKCVPETKRIKRPMSSSTFRDRSRQLIFFLILCLWHRSCILIFLRSEQIDFAINWVVRVEHQQTFRGTYWGDLKFIDNVVLVLFHPKAKMRLMKSLRETARHNIEFKSRRLALCGWVGRYRKPIAISIIKLDCY